MERRAQVAVLSSVAFMSVLAVGAFAYDSARDDLIADGVSVAGVDVGGLRASAARERLRNRLQRRLDRPVAVAVAGHRFHLTPGRAGLSVDVDGMVDAAVDEGRSGGLPARVWRGITGREIDSDLPARVDYSRVALKRFVRRVRRNIDRPARDASVKFETATLPAIPSETGLKLDRGGLRRSVEAALALPAGRQVRGDVKVIQPKVTTNELAAKYPAVITIDRPGFKLRFFKRLKLAKTYPIAVGQVGLETPAGLYHVQDKAVNPAWHVPKSPWAGDLAGRVIPPGPENPIKARWMGIYNGAGIHGTADIGSLGSAASHGCIRMAIPDVEELYDQVPLQAPVFIQ
jgi:lipoprotein-anchoring transpeptidase ErfK/SrfK